MNKTTFSLMVAVALLPVYAYSQFQGDIYRQYNGAKVLVSANTGMRLPWTGGVNNPHLAMGDLNNDGRKDIVIYELEANQVKTLIATGNGVYTYDSKYEGSFSGVYGYVQLVDFNRDGISDLVHRGMVGPVSVSYGYYSGNILKFTHYKDLFYQTKQGGWIDVHIPSGSLASIADVDGDTDLDIISYDFSGTTIVLYQNCQEDDNLPKDSIRTCLKDWCWGRTNQISQRQQLLGIPPCPGFHDPTCKGCGRAGQKTTDGSNTLQLIDIDSDGDFDYFNGHTGFPDIQLLYNGKSQFGVDSVLAQDTAWSSNGVTMHMAILPAAFLLNPDHDNDDDLLFTPMSEKTENYNSISLYENVGNNSNKNFVHKKNNYLVDEMIDMGRNSYPVFYDYDKDGKKDLFIGSEGYYQYPSGYNRSKIAYYRNTSAATGDFSFELVSDDFMGLWSKDYRGAALAIGDLDNDSLDDLVIGHTDGTFSFYKNTALSDTVQPNWIWSTDALQDNTGSTIDVGDYAAPAIYDIDADGKTDLVSGSQYGALYFFRNNSSVAGTNNLVMITNKLGNITLNSPLEPTPFTTPYFGPTDNTGKDYLVLGTKGGRLYRYDGFQNGAMPANYTMIDSVYSYISGHKYIAPAFANIDNDQDNLHELVLGNLLGGVVFYKQDFKVGIPDKVTGKKDVLVYPNPADKVLNITWGKDFNESDVQVQLISVTGQLMMRNSYGADKLSCSLDISGLSAGVYYCIVQSGPNRSVKPVSILK